VLESLPPTASRPNAAARARLETRRASGGRRPSRRSDFRARIRGTRRLSGSTPRRTGARPSRRPIRTAFGRLQTLVTS
jgi:hypothetical protein